MQEDIGIGIGLGVLWIAAYGLMDVVSWQKMFTLGSAKLVSVPASLSAGFCEEFLYRGFLFSVLAAAGAGKASRLVIASIAFGLAHCFWGPWGMGKGRMFNCIGEFTLIQFALSWQINFGGPNSGLPSGATLPVCWPHLRPVGKRVQTLHAAWQIAVKWRIRGNHGIGKYK